MEFFFAFFGLFSGFLMDDSAIAGGHHRGESISSTPIGISSTPIGISSTPIG
jgi:hypothetical protein